ncbi:phosphatase PAP2 family protein [Nocardioides dilutus]
MLLPRAVALRHRRVRWVLWQALIVASGVFFYFQVRGLTAADPDTAVDHAHDLIRFEHALGIDVEAAVQDAVAPSEAFVTFANWIYIWGHWPVIIATMLWLAWRHREVFLRLRDAMLVSGGLGLVVFVTYPVAPPRLVDQDLVDTVTERSSAYRYLQPPNFVNQYAAMPSLHAGWDLLVGISIAGAGTVLAVRLIGWILPLLMAFAVVATANHYLVDVVAGVALALFGLAVAIALERRRGLRSPSPVRASRARAGP